MNQKLNLRLGQISRKLNVGRNTIIDFLQKKGFNIDSNPNAKISQELFEILDIEFIQPPVFMGSIGNLYALENLIRANNLGLRVFQIDD